MAEINLLKSEQQARNPLSLPEGRKTGFYIAIALLVTEVLLYGFFMIYNGRLNEKIRAAESRSAEVDLAVGQLQTERQEAVSYQERLSNLDQLLQKHVFWSALLAELETFTYRGAVFDELQIDPGENKILIGGSMPTYTDLSKLLLGLTNSPQILDVQLISSGQAGDTGIYLFSIEIFFEPQVLLKKP